MTMPGRARPSILRRPNRPAPHRSTAPAGQPQTTQAPPADPATPATPPRVVVMTMVRDEGPMLARWVRHYAGQVGMENLVVLDDGSTDGSTDDLPCTVHRLPPLPGGRDYESTRMELASGLARGLLAVYDVVVFVDGDEFLIADPARYDSLLDLLATRADREVLAPMALNVVHHLDVEGALDPDAPVLGQRQFAKFVPLMCKPAVKRVPAQWRFATHGIMAPFAVDPDLFLVHLKFFDRDWLQRVSERRQEMVRADGRASRSSWSVGGDEMAQLLREFTAGVDPETVPEFDPASVDLAGVVHRDGEAYRTSRPGQLRAMETLPLVRVPERLLGLV